MRKAIAIVLLAGGVTGFSIYAFAKGPSGMGGIGSMGGNASHGPSYQSMPSQAPTNSNAPWTGTQEKGLDRAQERMSDQGLANEKATQNQDRQDSKPQTGRAPR